VGEVEVRCYVLRLIVIELKEDVVVFLVFLFSSALSSALFIVCGHGGEARV
jgi:hypothetical protein